MIVEVIIFESILVVLLGVNFKLVIVNLVFMFWICFVINLVLVGDNCINFNNVLFILFFYLLIFFWILFLCFLKVFVGVNFFNL